MRRLLDEWTRWTASFCLLLLLTGCGAGKPSGSTSPGGGNGGTMPIFSAASTLQWITQFGTGFVVPQGSTYYGYAGDTLTGIAVDPSGNVGVSSVVLGNFQGYTGSQIYKDALIKISSTGNVDWIREFTTNAPDQLTGIAADQSGNFYAGGFTQGAFPGYSNPSLSFQGMVAKFDPSGNRVWLQQFQLDSAFTYVASVAADDQGHLFVGGYSDVKAINGYTLFVECLDAATGQQIWSKTLGYSDFWNSLAVDNAGDVFVAGASNGPFPGNSSTIPEPFVLKLSGADGSLQWVQQFQAKYAGMAMSIFSVAATPDGSVVAGGAYSSKYIITIGQGSPDASDQCVLAKLDGATGNVDWINQFSTGAGDEIYGVGVDPQGNIAATGITAGVFAPGFQQPTNNVFILKFDPSGKNLWAQQIGNGPPNVAAGDIQVGPSLVVDTSGNIFVGNQTQGVFPGFSNPNNAVEMFVAKYGP